MKRNRVPAGRKIFALAAVVFLVSGMAAGCTSQSSDTAARITFVSKADYDAEDFEHVGIKVFDETTGALVAQRVYTDDPDFGDYLKQCGPAYPGVPCAAPNELLDLPPLVVPTGEDRRFVVTIFVWDKVIPNKLHFYEGSSTRDVLTSAVDVVVNVTAPSTLATIRGLLCADAGCAQPRDYGAIFVRDRETGVDLPVFNAFCSGAAPPAADTPECDTVGLDGGYYRIDLPPGRVYEISAMLNGLSNSMAPTPIYAEAGRRTVAPILVTPPNGTLDLFATAEPEGGRGTLSGNIQHTAGAQTSPFQGVEVRVGSPTFDTNNDPMDKIVFQQTFITDAAGNYSISPTPQIPAGNHSLEIVFLPRGTIHPTLTSVQINSSANSLSGAFTAAQLSNRAVDPVVTFPAAIVAGDTLGGGGLAVQVTDIDLDTTPLADTLAATIANNTTGESEDVILTETGPATGIFQLGTGLLTVGGLVGGTDNDGTLVVRSGNPVQMTFVDPIAFNGATAVPVPVPPVIVGNRAPVLAAIANITVGQGGPVSAPQVTASDLDTTDTLTFAVLNKPAWLLFTDNGDGTLDWSGTGPGTPGTFNITVQVTDSGTPTASDSQAVTVTVVPNLAPTLVNNTGLIVAEGAAGIIGSAVLLYNDADNTAAQLTYTLVTPPLYGQVRLGGSPVGVSGTFTQADINANQVDYLHDGTDGQPSDSFGFSLSDGINTISGQTFVFTITPVNDSPVLAMNAGKTVAEG
ncbi:MAG: cadherin-like domain-containing protein, partial [Bdellovibrionota bacterium]